MCLLKYKLYSAGEKHIHVDGSSAPYFRWSLSAFKKRPFSIKIKHLWNNFHWAKFIIYQILFLLKPFSLSFLWLPLQLSREQTPSSYIASFSRVDYFLLKKRKVNRKAWLATVIHLRPILANPRNTWWMKKTKMTMKSATDMNYSKTPRI